MGRWHMYMLPFIGMIVHSFTSLDFYDDFSWHCQREGGILESFQVNKNALCGIKSLFGLHVSSPDSVQFSHWVMSYSLWPHGQQHARPPCPSPTPRVYPNSCPLSQWCHPTISSSVVPFSSCLQSFPASGSFQMSQLFASGLQINLLVIAQSSMTSQSHFYLHLPT